jgi:hypothetical protein
MKSKTANQTFARIRVACALLALALPAAAQNTVSTHVASTCTVDEDSTAKYEFTGGELRFRGAETGAITVRCNVVDQRDDGQDPRWGVLEVVYRDPDGAGANQVTATLKRVGNTGVTSTVAGALFNSNSFAGAAGVQMRQANFAHAFNFFSNAYYIEIKLARSAATTQDNPAVFLARLAVPGPF